jgi:tetratricopeptide (TPR) repeat protein
MNGNSTRLFFVLFLAIFLFILPAAGSASFSTQDLNYKTKYECNGETIVVDHCRSDDDGPGMARTQPSADYCMVYYPSRPKKGGFTVQEVELRSDVVRKLTACNALTAPAPVSAAAPVSAPTNGAEAYDAQGDNYLVAKDYAKAIELYKKALAIDDSYAEGYAGLGVAYFQTNQWQLSVAAYEKYQTLAQMRPSYLFLFGEAHRELKQYDEALKAYRSMIALKPEKKFLVNAHFGIGETYWDMGQYQDAVSEFETVLQIDPTEANALRELGASYYKLMQYPKALAAVQQSIRLQPNNASTVSDLGFIYVKMGKRVEALEAYKTLLTLDKEMAQELYAEINK